MDDGAGGKGEGTMDCPFCGKEMRAGSIPSGSRMAWIEDGAVGESGREVALNGLFGGSMRAFFCPDCRQIVVPVPEIEGMAEKLQRKLNAAVEKIGAAQKQWEVQRGEEKERKKKKNLGEKDPWEW